MRFTTFFGHLGLMFGLLSVILMLYAVYVGVNPGGTSGVLFFPIIFWAVGLMFVLGEYFEAKHPD